MINTNIKVVSILVLMDTLLQQELQKIEELVREYGFNPCFNGYTTSTC